MPLQGSMTLTCLSLLAASLAQSPGGWQEPSVPRHKERRWFEGWACVTGPPARAVAVPQEKGHEWVPCRGQTKGQTPSASLWTQLTFLRNPHVLPAPKLHYGCLQPLLASGGFKAKEIPPFFFFFIKPWISLGFSTLRAYIWRRKPASTWFLFRKKLDWRNVPSRLPTGPKWHLGWVSSTVRTPLPRDTLVLLLIYLLFAASSMERGVQLPRSLPQQSQVHFASCSFLVQTQTPNTKCSF